MQHELCELLGKSFWNLLLRTDRMIYGRHPRIKKYRLIFTDPIIAARVGSVWKVQFS